MTTEIDTGNKYLVCRLETCSGQRVSILLRPHLLCPVRPAYEMTADEALTLAAWIVTMAENNATHPFRDVLEAVQNS